MKIIIIIIYTLGIKDPEWFGKNWKKIVGVTITPGSPQTQKKGKGGEEGRGGNPRVYL